MATKDDKDQDLTPEEKEELEPLTEKDILILDTFFLNGLNGARAWQFVHAQDKKDPAKTGPDIRSASVSFSRWLTKANIRAAMAERYKAMHMEAEEAFALKSAIARGSLEPFLNYGDDGFPFFDFSDDYAKSNIHLIKEMETIRERRIDGNGENAEEWETEKIKIKLHDAAAAQSEVLKIHGKLVDKVDLTSNGKSVENMVDEERHSRSISELANAIREAVSSESQQKKRKVVSRK